MHLHLHRRFGRARMCLAATLAAALLAGLPVTPSLADPDTPEPVVSAPRPTPLQLFAAAENAWNDVDANSLASLCDSSTVRVALKPGSPPASAPTLGAVAFLIQDQLRLVVSRRFQVIRLEVNGKKRTARAWARWIGEWGGARNTRNVEVVLQARSSGDAGWLLTEIRAND